MSERDEEAQCDVGRERLRRELWRRIEAEGAATLMAAALIGYDYARRWAEPVPLVVFSVEGEEKPGPCVRCRQIARGTQHQTPDDCIRELNATIDGLVERATPEPSPDLATVQAEVAAVTAQRDAALRGQALAVAEVETLKGELGEANETIAAQDRATQEWVSRVDTLTTERDDARRKLGLAHRNTGDAVAALDAAEAENRRLREAIDVAVAAWRAETDGPNETPLDRAIRGLRAALAPQPAVEVTEAAREAARQWFAEEPPDGVTQRELEADLARRFEAYRHAK